jgi:transcriptional/translational regulatory protein YebC/TACO1
MPKETLDRAIKKGAGLLGETVQYHRVTYEGFAPHQVPLIVECVTDNINRTVAEIRVAFRKGQLGASGSVAWDFNHVGMIEASPDTPDEPTDLDAVQKALPEQGFTVLSAKLGYQPKNPVSGLSDEQMAEVEAFLEGLDNHDDVQDMFVGLAG